MNYIQKMELWLGETLGLRTVYWIRYGENIALYVKMKSNGNDSAQKALNFIQKISKGIGGGDVKTGVLLQSQCNGNLNTVGVAEMRWSSGIESQLSKMGCVEVK